uniref:Uncharacterized protein n=1 Tax=Amphimedon queenslandica TaxID=400682 RepID=A0A1X7VGH1_AMPQE
VYASDNIIKMENSHLFIFGKIDKNPCTIVQGL